MTGRFGTRDTFAVEVGEILSPNLRVVDLWAAGKKLTTHDNVAYVPSLCHYMQTAAAEVRQRAIRPRPSRERSPEEIFRQFEADETDFRERYWFLQWSEIVDNVSCYAYLDDHLVIVFAFRRADHPFPEDVGKVFVARIPPDEFAATLEQATDLLGDERVG
ncbi:hypothetical protein ACGFH8_15920 [Micromonospora sp. NPDC049175]|uniref:hypothetical protein n=1 Tax=Micromonospora sp. NPDC049175 TaxID=3364266 RepID=UPI0037155F6E